MSELGIYHPAIDLMASLAAVERMHILRVLEACDGNITDTAESLGINPKTVRAKLRAYNGGASK
jgi:DNA-binding NtrC family response regulator